MAKSLNLLYIILLIIIINFSHAVDFCYYQQNKDDEDGVEATSSYLSQNTEDKSAAAVCHSLSHTPVNTEKCCYDTTDGQCVYSDKEETDFQDKSRYKCPEDTVIHNSCGMAGVYQPIEESVCTEISLVGGYCCFVTSKKDGVNSTSCLRNQKLSKNVNDITDQIKEALAYNNSEFVSMKCQGSYMKNIWMIVALVTLFLF